MLNESGGCEPEFALRFTRRTVGMTDGEDTYYDVYCKAAREYIALNHCTFEDLPECFVASKDIDWRDRVATQAAMQKHVDTAISSTVNLPNEATMDDIAHLYLEAWKQKLKGITIFRDGCKRIPILSDKKKDAPSAPEQIAQTENLPRGYVIEASDSVIGKKRKLQTGCGSLHCIAMFDPQTGDLLETYLSKGSSGGCQNYMVGLSRMISLAARSGCDIHNIVDQLSSCGTCPSYAVRQATKHDTSQGSCCPVAIGNALVDMWNEMRSELFEDGSEHTVQSEPTPPATDEDIKACPECGAGIRHEGGCVQCPSCGWSKCS